MNEISLHKNNEPNLQARIHYELVLMFMQYYFILITLMFNVQFIIFY